MQSLEELKRKSQEALSYLPEYNFKYGLNIKLNPPSLNFDKIKNAIQSTSYINCPISILIKSRKDEDTLNYLNTVIPFDTNKFTSLHYSQLNDIMFITVPKNSAYNEPIIINNDTDKEAFSHIIVLAEENSKITVIDKDFSEKESAYYSKCVELILKDNAKVNYIHLQNIKSNKFNFCFKKARASKDAEVRWFDLFTGSDFCFSTTECELEEQGSSAEALGVFIGNGKQQFDVNNSTKHIESNTTSNIKIRNVVDDNAKSIYNGLIRIEKEAPNSKGYQKVDALTLKETAEADAIPRLEIENHDVRCSHGASIGEIDKSQLFYLMSRGLTEEEARKMIVSGFIEPIVKEIPIEELKNDIRDIINKKLK